MSVEEARAPRQQGPPAHDGFVPPSSRRGDRALAEMLGEAACVASLDDLAALLARGLVDVFCARSSLVYLATRDERSLVLVASRNADDPAPIVDIEWALPAARAARRRANVFLSFPPAPSGRGGAVSSTDSPLAFAAPILVGPRLIGAFSAGFSRGLSPDRCAALGSLGDALGALAAHLQPTMGAPLFTIDRDVAGFGLGESVRLANAHVALTFPTGVGPRILGFGPRGGENLFGFVPAARGDSLRDPSRFRLFGGHRLQVAPEDLARTYAPDNAPIRWRVTASGAVLPADVDAAPLEKELEITLDPGAPRVRIEHRITNRGAEATFAPWALSVMRTGGGALVPNAPFVPHPAGLLPARTLVVWPYTWLADPRLRWGKRLLRVAQDPARSEPLKLGAFVEQGWVAYAVADVLFVKHFPAAAGEHPDRGCNFETFTNADFLELESLGPLRAVAPGETVRHVEVWTVFANVRLEDDDDSAAGALAPLVGLGAEDASTRP